VGEDDNGEDFKERFARDMNGVECPEMINGRGECQGGGSVEY